MQHSTTLQPLRLAREMFLVVAGAVLYLGLRSYQNTIATGQSQAAVSLSEWIFGNEGKMQSVMMMNLLLDIPFAIMSGVLIAAILIGLKPRSLIWAGIAVALLSEVAWLFIWDTLASGWIIASRMIAVMGLIGGCLWLQRFWKHPPSEISSNKNTPGQTGGCSKTEALIG